MPPAPSDGLGTTNAPDLLEIVPPAPVAGDPRDLADRAIFRATRSAENSPDGRWRSATPTTPFPGCSAHLPVRWARRPTTATLRGLVRCWFAPLPNAT